MNITARQLVADGSFGLDVTFWAVVDHHACGYDTIVNTPESVDNSFEFDASVPEPASVATLAIGAVGLALSRRK